MSPERLLLLAPVVLLGLLLVRLVPATIRSWRIYAGIRHRHQEDVTGHAPTPPDGVAQQAQFLAGHGYHGLGETRVRLPGGDAYAWIGAADDAESYSMLAGSPREVAVTAIYSAWPDGTWLGTIHPEGSPLTRPGLAIRVITTTVSDAVAAHRAGIAGLRSAHGAPRPIRTMADMLALDLDYRARFGGDRLRPQLERLVTIAATVAGLFVASLVLLALAPG